MSHFMETSRPRLLQQQQYSSYTTIVKANSKTNNLNNNTGRTNVPNGAGSVGL